MPPPGEETPVTLPSSLPMLSRRLALPTPPGWPFLVAVVLVTLIFCAEYFFSHPRLAPRASTVDQILAAPSGKVSALRRRTPQPEPARPNAALNEVWLVLDGGARKVLVYSAVVPDDRGELQMSWVADDLLRLRGAARVATAVKHVTPPGIRVELTHP